MLALNASLVNVIGGYLRTHGVWAASLTASYLPGPYRWPSYRCRVSCIMTSKTPTGTVAAPGFYEGTFVRERMIDLLAARAGLDPAEMRRRNLARPQDQPYTVSTVAAAVSGRTADFAGEDFGEMFEHALKAGRYASRLAECRRRNAAGGDVRYGVGLAAVVETSGTGPFESAKVILTSEGRIELAAGATSLGQGLPTTLAQVCADVIEVPPADIGVHLGDTRWIAHGVGSSASRSAVMAGAAVHQAAMRLREQIVAVAAAHFEASPVDVTLEDGAAFVRGVPDRRCSLREIAALAGGPLEAEYRHETAQAIGSFGVHLSVVGVDVTTGEVRPDTHFVLCDVGRAINPTIVEGQLVGAVVQGLGHAIMEELVYDPSGQLLSSTFMDYALPTAAWVPADRAPHPRGRGAHKSPGREGRRRIRHLGRRRRGRQRGGRRGRRRGRPPPPGDGAAGQGGALVSASPYPFQRSRITNRSSGGRRLGPYSRSGQPSGMIAALSTLSGMPRISWMRALRRRCKVVSTVPRPSARAASMRFCTLG